MVVMCHVSMYRLATVTLVDIISSHQFIKYFVGDECFLQSATTIQFNDHLVVLYAQDDHEIESWSHSVKKLISDKYLMNIGWPYKVYFTISENHCVEVGS